MANICLTEYVQVFLISYRQVTEEDGIVVTITVTTPTSFHLIPHK